MAKVRESMVMAMEDTLRQLGRLCRTKGIGPISKQEVLDAAAALDRDYPGIGLDVDRFKRELIGRILASRTNS